MNLMIVLQNAYFSDGQERTRENWLNALWRSHTGKRLQEMIPEGIDVTVINASKNIGDTAKSIFPPEPEHIKAKVEEYEPDVILACGRIAEQGVKKAGLEYIQAPHPAYRALSKEMTKEIREKINGRINL